MSADPGGGIHLSSRVLFFLILISICINIVFLCIGILIGREDLKWSGAGELPVTEITEDGTAPPRIDDELANFETSGMDLEAGSRAAQSVQEPEPTPILPTAADSQPDPGPPDPDPPTTTPPVTRQESSRPSAAQATPASAAGYWIQVSASRDKKAADAFLAKLRQGGYTGGVIAEGGFYKVQAGPYPTRRAAQSDLNLINKRFGVKGWIRTR